MRIRGEWDLFGSFTHGNKEKFQHYEKKKVILICLTVKKNTVVVTSGVCIQCVFAPLTLFNVRTMQRLNQVIVWIDTLEKQTNNIILENA